ncbi:MAG: outer membrane protein assembly factor BamE [Oleiphilaceae bacterium]|nr:outer membrane protein assembly factor BamE [Oleiphilaceae bacterium]
MRRTLKSAHRRSVASLLLLAWLSGCATVGQEFPAAPVSDIRIGETSKEEVREMFGPPWRVGVENGKRTWTYGHYRYRLIGEPSTRDLLIRFNSRNIVEHFSFNTTEYGNAD